MPISPIESSAIQGLTVTENNSIQRESVGTVFGEFLSRANATIHESEIMSADFAAGKQNNIHETMLAAERATISFQLVGAVRNRVLTAYNEVMHMRL